MNSRLALQKPRPAGNLSPSGGEGRGANSLATNFAPGTLEPPEEGRARHSRARRPDRRGWTAARTECRALPEDSWKVPCSFQTCSPAMNPNEHPSPRPSPLVGRGGRVPAGRVRGVRTYCSGNGSWEGAARQWRSCRQASCLPVRAASCRPAGSAGLLAAKDGCLHGSGSCGCSERKPLCTVALNSNDQHKHLPSCLGVDASQ